LKQRDGMQEETDRLKADLEKIRTAKASQEDLLRKTEKVRALLDERTRLQEEIATADARINEKEERRKDLLAVAWKGLVRSRIRVTRDGLEKELRDARQKYQRVLVSDDMAQKLRNALETGDCITCGQSLSPEAKQRICAAISETLP